MKWFQVDADTPNDPKVRAIRRDLGIAGVGGLFLLWCHIADHGVRKPGWSITSAGTPIPEADLIDASGLSGDEFARLAAICTSSCHWLRKPWETRRVIAIPAMARRADTYTKSQLRSRVEAAAKTQRRNFANKTVQDKTNKTAPRRGAIAGTVCPHRPRCTSTAACITKVIDDGRKDRKTS